MTRERPVNLFIAADGAQLWSWFWRGLGGNWRGYLRIAKCSSRQMANGVIWRVDQHGLANLWILDVSRLRRNKDCHLATTYGGLKTVGARVQSMMFVTGMPAWKRDLWIGGDSRCGQNAARATARRIGLEGI